MPGFPGVVLIPLGRLSTSPIPLLARVALWFHHPHVRAGYIHTRHISEWIEAVAIARQACGYAQRCGKQLLGHPRAMPGVWGGFALQRVLPREEFMGSFWCNLSCHLR